MGREGLGLKGRVLQLQWGSLGDVGPAPLQKGVGDFYCINFGGFCLGFS